MSDSYSKKVLFSGGGTIGPVTPLLALYEELSKRHPNWEFHWNGTETGPERTLLAKARIPFVTLPEVKLDRFLSFRNFFVPFKLIYAVIQARKLLVRMKPDIIVTAGGYVSVPLVWAGKLMGIPSYVHQLDIQPGLANKLMSKFATKISVTFEPSLKDYPESKTVLTGAPVRKEIFHPSSDVFSFSNSLPTVFIFGGGTGAQAINELTWNALEELLTICNVIHVTGKGKSQVVSLSKELQSNYIQKEFLTSEMAEGFAKASLVITRGGLGTLLELAALKKPSIMIPIPNSQQEENTQFVQKANAAIVLNQLRLSPMEYAAQVKSVLNDSAKQQQLSSSIANFYHDNAAMQMAEVLESIIN